MKNLISLILLCPALLSAQQVFDFEDGLLEEWNQLPKERWDCSPEDAVRGELSLHHAYDNPGSGMDNIIRDLQYADLADTLQFSFLIRHAYNPSRVNNWQVFFLNEDEEELHNCFVFGVNFEGSDDQVKLWQVMDGEASEIINTGINYESAVGKEQAASFSISRSPDGRWTAGMVLPDTDHNDPGKFSGKEYKTIDGRYFGIRYSYSSSQDRKLWVDDIRVKGTFYQDDEAPLVDSLQLAGLNSLVIYYNESVLLTPASKFYWQDREPDSVAIYDKRTKLFFPYEFPNRQLQELSVRGIADRDQNILRDTTLSFMQNLFEFGEIVINEIMPDPEPAIYLPECEYIELFNNCPYVADLKNWVLTIKGKEYRLPYGKLGQGEYIVLCSDEDAFKFNNVTPVPVLPASSALANDGGLIRLFDPYQRLIHQAEYRNIAFYDPLKEDGGWSLERLDPGIICGGTHNWAVSSHPSGGTPGALNSIYLKYSDTEPPYPLFAGIKDSSNVCVEFSEDIMIKPSQTYSFQIESIGAASPVFSTVPQVNSSVELRLPNPLEKSRIYALKYTSVGDCEGNEPQGGEISLALPEFPIAGMIILNELMYDPWPGRLEYLELLNVSDHFIDLRELKISLGSESHSFTKSFIVSDLSHLLAPGRYTVLTSNALGLRTEWELGPDVDVVELQDWKSLPDSEGYIRLLNRSELELDRLHYHDSMHHDLLKDPVGVSLERLSDSEGYSVSPWLSAAASVNYGTPGRKNSRKARSGKAGETVDLQPGVFSPDGDGYEDIMEIIVHSDESEAYVNIYITDLKGNVIRQLRENSILGSEDHFCWDGHDEQHHLVLPGLYIVHTVIRGRKIREIFRLPCAVVYR